MQDWHVYSMLALAAGLIVAMLGMSCSHIFMDEWHVLVAEKNEVEAELEQAEQDAQRALAAVHPDYNRCRMVPGATIGDCTVEVTLSWGAFHGPDYGQKDCSAATYLICQAEADVRGRLLPRIDELNTKLRRLRW